MTPQERFNQIKLRSVSLNGSLQSAQQSYNSHLRLYSQTESEFLQAKKLSENLIDAIDRMKLIVEKFSSGHIKELESLVTSGLRTIFYDRSYSLHIVVSDKRDNKYAEFFLKEDLHNSTLEIPLKRSNVAGGILVVVGFILQTYYISYFNLSPVIIVDEAFSQLSDEYLPGLFTFMDRLRVLKNFIIILVTHDNRFLQYADRMYLCENGKFKLIESKDKLSKIVRLTSNDTNQEVVNESI